MKPLLFILSAIAAALPAGAAQPNAVTNSVGMEFVLIPAGSFTYGKLMIPYPPGSLAASGLTAAQGAAVTKMNESVAALDAAATAARTALLGGSLGGATPAQLEAQAKTLADAESALAMARAEAFSGIQRSADRLGAVPKAALVQATATATAAGRAGAAGRGGRGGDPAVLAKADEMIAQDRAKYPGFNVNIPREFYLGKYEVTQAEWVKVMGSNPSVFQTGRFGVTDGDRHPVDSVTWADAQAFVRKLNEMENTTAYRLPTEFEWEYAGRAGATDDPTWEEIRLISVRQNSSVGTTMAVGTKPANAWGLHDMLGNTWEWVQDYYNEKLYNDPVPPTSGTEHVLKGGGFLSDVKNTIYSTHGGGPGDKYSNGFRIVREAR